MLNNYGFDVMSKTLFKMYCHSGGGMRNEYIAPGESFIKFTLGKPFVKFGVFNIIQKYNIVRTNGNMALTAMLLS